MAKRKITKPKKHQDSPIELAKEVTTSIIAVTRESELKIEFLEPKQLDEVYALVPEISRAIDLRGSSIISRGYEITARNDSEEAKKYASLCLGLLNNSGGVSFVEQWQKNSDLYGNGYVEIVEDTGTITKLVHVHPYLFGYELEEYTDPVDNQLKTKIKLDSDTQEPVGYAQYVFNENKNVLENAKIIEKEKIAHLKYKVIGDALYGISIVQPMYGSVVRKLKIEDHIEAAARLVAAPKIVISGKFPSEEDARREAKEAASLDISDVVILDSDDGKSFEIVNPGQTNLPELREIFVVNITAASGVPRPILTSESSEINKATMQELMKQLRENMRSNMNKMKNIMEKKIFTRIGEVYNIPNYSVIVPIFTFPEDPDTEDEIINREEKKAATLTSLSNSIKVLSDILVIASGDIKISTEKSIIKTLELYELTADTFLVNNDQDLGLIEETPTQESQDVLKLGFGESELDEESSEFVDIIDVFEQVSFIEDNDRLRQPEILKDRHDLLHRLYEAVRNGTEIYDSVTGEMITLPAIVKRHEFYIHIMEQIGVVHEVSELAPELDELL